MGKILTLSEFADRRSGDREPLLDLNWYCLELPFGGELDYVETVSLPFPSINMKPAFYGSRFVQYPGFLEISAFDITFYEDKAVRTRKWIKDWQERIRNPKTGTYGLPSDYKRDMSFALTNGKDSTPILTVVCRDCWPTTPAGWDLSNNGGQALKTQVNFATDGVDY